MTPGEAAEVLQLTLKRVDGETLMDEEGVANITRAVVRALYHLEGFPNATKAA
jgi:hypothetical protein